MPASFEPVFDGRTATWTQRGCRSISIELSQLTDISPTFRSLRACPLQLLNRRLRASHGHVKVSVGCDGLWPTCGIGDVHIYTRAAPRRLVAFSDAGPAVNDTSLRVPLTRAGRALLRRRAIGVMVTVNYGIGRIRSATATLDGSRS